MLAVATLAPPVLPQAVGGIISTGDPGNDPIVVRVPAYQYRVLGDEIRVMFGTVPGRVSITLANYAASFYDVPFPAATIPAGDWSVSYEIESPAHNVSVSDPVDVSVVTGSVVSVPAPVFPDAVRGGISLARVQGDGFLRIEARYPQIAAGDVLTLRWAGRDASGTDVPASHATLTGTVTQAEASQGGFIWELPASYVQGIGVGGMGTASYTVRLQDGRMGSSAPATLRLTQVDEDAIVLRATSGAPPWDAVDPLLRPVNWVSVLGAPGQVLKVEVDAGAQVGEAVVHDPFKGLLRLGEDGRGRFWVALADLSVHPAYVVKVVLTDQDDTTLTADLDVTFKPYQALAQGGVACVYGVTTGATADGTIPCTLSLRLEASSEDADVALAVGGKALISGQGQTLQVHVAAGGHLVVNVLDETVEAVTLQVTLDAAGGAGGTASFNAAMDFLPVLGAASPP